MVAEMNLLRRQAQRYRDLGHRSSLDPAEVKDLIAARWNLFGKPLQGAAHLGLHAMALILGRWVGFAARQVGFYHLAQLLGWMTPAPADHIDNLVAGHGIEPGVELASLRIVLEPAQTNDDLFPDLL